MLAGDTSAAPAGKVATTTILVGGETVALAGKAGVLAGATVLPGRPKLVLLAAIATTPSTTRRPPNRPLSVIRFIRLGNYPLAKVLLLEWHQIGSRELLDQGKEFPRFDQAMRVASLILL